MNTPSAPLVTDAAPKAIGPYSQGYRAGSFVFTSGQIALDPVSGQLVGSDVASQTRRVLQNLKAVLEAGGASTKDVVRCTVFLRDMKDFPAMNAVYAECFPAPSPARTTVAAAGLPKDALIEIDAIAYLPN